MTATTERPRPAPVRRKRAWFGPLLLRMHFYAGILVGPFILVAALTGAAYALTPGLEQAIYRDVLTAQSTGTPRPLAEQVAAAETAAGDDSLIAVRPAPTDDGTTRVMFTGDGLIESQTRAIFVDPVTLDIRGDVAVYGTSGALPLRTAIGDIHRSLGLGDAGRLYSELAASWLGVVVVGGLVLWAQRWRGNRAKRRELLVPDLRATGRRRFVGWHTATGIWLAVGALFLSATGITWSQHAGTTVSTVRAALDWSNPTLDTGAAGASGGDHAGHGAHAGHGSTDGAAAVDPASFDSVLRAATSVNIDARELEIRPGADGAAWTVTEIKRTWPTQVDAVAIDPGTLAVIDRTDFEDYPFMAKLARWGIDTHMGTLFGLANQLVLVAAALGIAAMVVFGYVMWWKRRPTRRALSIADPVPGGALTRAPWWGVALVAAGAVALSVALPLLGWSLLAFVLGDALLSLRRTARAEGARSAR